jgi:predicted DCC family thiol-disulfide oxidoreductase YuxK
MSSSLKKQSDIILFDGVCNLCSSSVQFIIKRDPKARYKFASLQSDFGQRFLEEKNLSTADFHSLIVIKNGAYLQRSDAALEIARHLSGLWPVFDAFKFLPRLLRDPVYNWISRNRYNWFGKKESCWLPTVELRSRFLDNGFN